jgi:predicted nucleic acid-binding protein
MHLRELVGSRVYLDANVFIYAYEEHRLFSPAARALRALHERGELRIVTSQWTLAEILVAPIRNRDRKAQRHYRGIFDSAACQVQAIGQDVLLEAARLTALLPLTLPDATHVATAKLTNCNHLVTNDGDFGEVTTLNIVRLTSLVLE